MSLWFPQVNALNFGRQAFADGFRKVVVTSPTGSGKSVMIVEFAKSARAKGKRVGIFTNRKILTKQMTDTLTDHGIDHGVMASGYDPALLRDVQLMSFQTIESRVFKSDRWELPELDLALVDEAHSNVNETAVKILSHYRDIIGFTATPVGLESVYEKLVVAAKPQELIKAGILVGCDVFSPSEPDMKGVRTNEHGEFSEKAMRGRAKLIFGDVFDHWLRLNPDRLPTVVFAPGVEESKAFVERFNSMGFPAEHIDGDTPQSERDEIFARIESRETTVVSSCGVLREGWNCPCICHGILAQPCAAISTYIQIAGRLLRSYPGKERAVLQDHGGAFWRFGPPDADRDWELGDTNKELAKATRERRESGKEKEPICCPKCAYVRHSGPRCPNCGHQHERSVRHVRMTDGRLVAVSGQVVKVKQHGPDKTPEQKAWDKFFWMGKHSNLTFSQAKGLFNKQMGYFPPSGLSNMPPAGSLDWGRKIKDVPWENLNKSRA